MSSNINEYKNDTLDVMVDLNNTDTYACVATEHGFMIYNPCPFKSVLSRDIQGGVYRVKMLHKTNIILFVGRVEKGPYPNNKLIVWDDVAQEVVSEISYPDKVISFHATRKYIYVQTEKKLYIYQLNTLLLVKQIDTVQSPVFSVAECETHNTVVYPSSQLGHIDILNVDTGDISTIYAHYGTIEVICVSHDGKYIATASDKGTIVRMYSVDTRDILHEFRRGIEYVRITQLLFHPSGRILLASSDRGSIHLYNTEIDDTARNDIPPNRVYERYGMNVFKYALPKYFSSKWGFTSYQIPNVVTTSLFHPTEPILYSFGRDGQFYECHYADASNPIITKTMKFVRDGNDPFRALPASSSSVNMMDQIKTSDVK
jgi:WD40 repeat protein